jgi:hypothetical protein
MLELMNNTVNIRSVSVSTGTTGNAYTYTTLYTALPVMIQPTSGAPHLSNDVRKVLISHRIFTYQSITVSPGNQIVFGSRVFQILFVRNLCEAGIMFALDCQERFDETV